MPNKPTPKERPWNIKRPNQKFNRTNKRDRRYKTYRWKLLRLEVLKEQDYTCQECLNKGIVKHGNVCDHISNEQRRIDFWNKDNLQCLCDRCHNRKSQSERRITHK